jgi:hypothetical protein
MLLIEKINTVNAHIEYHVLILKNAGFRKEEELIIHVKLRCHVLIGERSNLRTWYSM